MNKINQHLIFSLGLAFSLTGPISSYGRAVPEFPPAVFVQTAKNNVALGRLLFFDPVLSGNRNISCATCHHPKLGTSDGVSLSLGEGGMGLGLNRHTDPDNLPEQRVPRNSPALFNLGAAQFTSLFHDGRLEIDATRVSGIRTPLADDMALGFTSILSAQAMFPVLSADEMAGQYSENDVSKAVRQGFLTHLGGAWDIISARVAAITEYRVAFDNIIGPREIDFADIANVIADFVAYEWRADNSDFDKYLSGKALSVDAAAGMQLFYGKAECSTCHAGRFQTDHEFHAIAMPQIGPGKAARFENHQRDLGRMRVTGRLADAYRFRTPSLRNVTMTEPYGHAGAYATLEDVIRHHLNPINSLKKYDRQQAKLPKLVGAKDWVIMDSPVEIAAIAAANELEPSSLKDTEIDAILAFLQALTDTESLSGRMGVPESVPSGLPLD